MCVWGEGGGGLYICVWGEGGPSVPPYAHIHIYIYIYIYIYIHIQHSIYTYTYTSIYSTLDLASRAGGGGRVAGGSSLNLLIYWIFLENTMLLLNIDWILLDFFGILKTFATFS